MQVKVLSEGDNTIALLGIGLSYGKTSGLNFEDILKDTASNQNLLETLHKVSLNLKDLDGGENKFLRQIPITLDITAAPLFWWKEFDTYKIGTTAQSESTMHSITRSDFDLSKFETNDMNAEGREILSKTVEKLNELRQKFLTEENQSEKKCIWYNIICNLPDCWLQRRIVTLNYAVLQNMISKRKHHKLYQWRYFCKTVYEQVKHPEYLETQYLSK